jgi:hypothetical protein
MSLGREYWRDVPDDAALVARFERHFATCPAAYAPLRYAAAAGWRAFGPAAAS